MKKNNEGISPVSRLKCRFRFSLNRCSLFNSAFEILNVLYSVVTVQNLFANVPMLMIILSVAGLVFNFHVKKINICLHFKKCIKIWHLLAILLFFALIYNFDEIFFLALLKKLFWEKKIDFIVYAKIRVINSIRCKRELALLI